MTGNINIDGTATIVTVADSQGDNSKVLTVNGSGLVQYSNNLMPKGGIIMWSGTIATIPTGWALCDGSGTWGGTNPIPDLRERFIVGAGGNNDGVVTFDYNTFIINKQLAFVNGPPGTNGLSPTGNAIINGTFTKTDDNAGVAAGKFFNDAAWEGGNPFLTSQYALYRLTGPTSPTSYYIVYNKYVDRYRMYRGTVPANNTDISNPSNHNYFEFPAGALAQLRQVGNVVTFRPNHIDLSWQQSATGYAVNDIGGFNDVQLQISEMPSHRHGNTTGFLIKSDGLPNFASGYDTNGVTTFAGNDFPHENRPQYYALAFIIYTG